MRAVASEARGEGGERRSEGGEMDGLIDIYPTRGEREAILPRRDPVVFGEGGGTAQDLDADQRADYERKGFLILPGLFSTEEAEAMLAESRRLARLPELQGRDELVLEPGSGEPRSIFSPHRFSVLFDRVSRDPRILAKVTQLLGGEVYIHHGRINIKKALSGRSFPWHSDFETWHAEDGLPRMRVLSAWIMLTENSPLNGPLFLIPESHRHYVSCVGATPEGHHKESLRKQEYGVPSLESLRRLAEAGGLVSVCGAPGTLVIHEGNMMHGSPDNITPWSRTNLFFVYNSVLNKPAERPFAAPAFRPEFLSGRDHKPLTPIE